MYKIYTVQTSDTLENIANQLGITAEVLATLNGLDPSVQLKPNTNIVIPNNSNFEKYIVKNGDNIYTIARKYNTDPKELLKLNGLEETDYIYPNEEITVPKQGTQFYITKENDTLNKIANEFKTTPNDIANQNKTIYLIEDQLIIYKK